MKRRLLLGMPLFAKSAKDMNLFKSYVYFYSLYISDKNMTDLSFLIVMLYDFILQNRAVGKIEKKYIEISK